MIFQSLCDYYARAKNDPSRNLPPYGYAKNPISFVIRLDASGRIRNIIPRNSAEEKKKRSENMLTPSLGKARTSGIEANFLWDKPSYVFGVDTSEKTQRTHAVFVELHERLLEKATDPGLQAVLAFVRSWRPEDAPSLPLWERILGGGTTNNLVFRLVEVNSYVHESEEAQEIWRRHLDAGHGADAASSVFGRCLVTGENTTIAQLHPALKGMHGAQPSGAGLSTYNKESFKSFNKEQNYNAPVGKYAAFAYTAALNSLLADPNRCRVLGDSTLVVWAGEPSDAEEWISQLIVPEKVAATGDKADEEGGDGRRVDERTAQGVQGILKKLMRGKSATGEIEGLNPGAVFHLLCLAPNVARLSVRFHVRETLLRLLERSERHHSQLRIVRRFEKEPEFITPYKLAEELAGKHKKAKDIQRLFSDVVEAIITGRRYPQYLFGMAIDRIRAEGDVTYVKAALLKAMLIRNHKKEIPVSLNQESADAAYQLGRLFALLVGVQRKALGEINANIRDKFYGAASATPALVFPLLIKNAQNHISKAKAGGYDKLIGEALSHIDSGAGFPRHLTLERQGQFALGYYHQRCSGRNAVNADEIEEPEADEE